MPFLMPSLARFIYSSHPPSPYMPPNKPLSIRRARNNREAGLERDRPGNDSAIGGAANGEQRLSHPISSGARSKTQAFPEPPNLLIILGGGEEQKGKRERLLLPQNKQLGPQHGHAGRRHRNPRGATDCAAELAGGGAAAFPRQPPQQVPPE